MPFVVDVDHRQHIVRSNARTIAELLRYEHIGWSNSDRLTPSADAPLPIDGLIRIAHRRQLIQHVCQFIEPSTLHRSAHWLLKGQQKVIASGHQGRRETTIRTIFFGDTIAEKHEETRIIERERPRIIAVGTRVPQASPQLLSHPLFLGFARGAFQEAIGAARSVFRMVATAYIPFCDTCSGTGIGASGMRVTHGVVAVDPHVIPLGTHLFIPGYGPAIAGDTGGAIIGQRIDLAFNTLREAVDFGRRPVTVYVLAATDGHR